MRSAVQPIIFRYAFSGIEWRIRRTSLRFISLDVILIFRPKRRGQSARSKEISQFSAAAAIAVVDIISDIDRASRSALIERTTAFVSFLMIVPFVLWMINYPKLKRNCVRLFKARKWRL
jgi:hypothetical protein